MDPVSHVALFYLLGRSVKLPRLWAALVAAVFPDITQAGILLVASSGDPASLSAWWTLYLLLHSVFPVVALLPFALVARRLVRSVAAGYATHLILDYLTHSELRMPLFPLSDWKFPIFIGAYYEELALLATNTLVFVLLVFVSRNQLSSILRRILKARRRPQTSIFVGGYLLATALSGVALSSIILGSAGAVSYLCAGLLASNSAIVGFLFLSNLAEDELLGARVRRIGTFVFGEAPASDTA